MSGHIVKSYDAEFSELDRMTAQIGGLAEKLLAESFEAVMQRDPKLAGRAIESDRAIDLIERQVQERAVTMIARRQPVSRTATARQHRTNTMLIPATSTAVGSEPS